MTIVRVFVHLLLTLQWV